MVLAQENEQDLLDVMDTNFSGYIFCIKAAYRMMKKYDSAGHIVNLNSVFGHMPLGTASLRMAPLFNLYPTSKHALVALVETIRDELNYLQIKKIKISVDIIMNYINYILTNNFFFLISSVSVRVL